MMPVPAPSSVNSKNRPLFTDSTEIEATTSSTLSTRSAIEGSCPASEEPAYPGTRSQSAAPVALEPAPGWVEQESQWARE